MQVMGDKQRVTRPGETQERRDELVEAVGFAHNEPCHLSAFIAELWLALEHLRRGAKDAQGGTDFVSHGGSHLTDDSTSSSRLF